MPRYYFDLHNDLDVIDDQGVILATFEDARAHAFLEAREMIRSSVDGYARIDLGHRIAIRDEHGAMVGTVRFDEAVLFVRDKVPV